MPKIHHAKNVEDAVEMAAKFKDEGIYNWFRGQTQAWPPYSSMFRLKQQATKTDQAEQDYMEFIHWAKNKDELKHLTEPEHIHKLEAILQHYGFPTDYIDFSTEPSVAGFFAADTKEPPVNAMSCIYCLNVDELMDVWNTIKDFDGRTAVTIEKIIINVDNLWRLQAQHGVFLKADYNWDLDYPMDKIIFPYEGYPSYPPQELIYPENKSALEILLDEYFDLMRIKKAVWELSELFGKPQKMNVFPGGYHQDAFREVLTPLPSWSGDNLQAWRLLSSEEFEKASGFMQRINLQGKHLPEDVRSAVFYLIKHLQRSNKDVRQRAINWVIENTTPGLDSTKAANLIGIIWNAMRQKPFTSEDIAAACANTIYLLMHDFRQLRLDQQLALFEEMSGKGFPIGMSIKAGNGANAFLSHSSFNGMINGELKGLLKEDFKKLSGSPNSLFSIIYNPSCMFDFELFSKAFAKEIIPTALLVNSTFVIFNPAQITILGNR